MNEILNGKKIILGITGSVAAYKSPLLVRELIKSVADVRIIMTPSSKHFVSLLVMSNLSRNPVIADMFDENVQTSGAWHIELAHWCDLLIIAPCSAATIGRIANGICDTALAAIVTAIPESTARLISPAMDSTMWMSKAVQRNVSQLESDGFIIIPPDEGELSSGLTGPGRMPETDILMKYIIDTLKKNSDSKNISIETNQTLTNSSESDINYKITETAEKSLEPLQQAVDRDKWEAEYQLANMRANLSRSSAVNHFKGKKVIITAGPTREKIDDVRYISNNSSGKMGFALAESANRMGAEVILIAGPVSIPAPAGITRFDTLSSQEMYDKTLEFEGEYDIAILSAAVADFQLANPFDGKIKKNSTGDKFVLELTPTKDILGELGKSKKEGQILVGFALESENIIENARRKLIKKNCDLIVANMVNAPRSGFGGDDNTISIFGSDEFQKNFPPINKKFCAEAILNEICNFIDRKANIKND